MTVHDDKSVHDTLQLLLSGRTLTLWIGIAGWSKHR